MDEQRVFGVLLSRPDHYAAYGRHVYRAFALPAQGDTINVEEVLTATIARARVTRILANPEFPIAAVLDEPLGGGRATLLPQRPTSRSLPEVPQPEPSPGL